MGAIAWGDIVEVASRCWTDVVDAELAIAVHVLALLDWRPRCAFRGCHSVTAQAFEVWAAQPVASAEISWVRVPGPRQAECLRFLGQHCRNARHVAVRETAQLGERLLLRLVCGMRLLESLEVGASPFGGSFPDPQRLLDRLARYCPRLQHLSISFRHEAASERQTLGVRALASLGRRLLTLDLGAVAVRVAGGTRTLAVCCPQLQRLSAQLCQQHEHPSDAVDPSDLSRGCKFLQDLDLAPVDWNDGVLKCFVAEAPQLSGLALRHVAPDASPGMLAPLLVPRQPGSGPLLVLHLALHARTDRERAQSWLQAVAQLRGLRSLCLDYAAPLRLESVVEILSGGIAAGGGVQTCCSTLVALTVHGCHGIDDGALGVSAQACSQLQHLRLFPDSFREAGEVSDNALNCLVAGQSCLRGLAVGARTKMLTGVLATAGSGRLKSLSLFAPLDDGACLALSSWGCLRHLWLGPQKLMQHGVAAESSISDAGLELIALHCPGLLDLTVASRCAADAGVAVLFRCCWELRRLRLGGRGITDASLAVLRGLAQPRLERLALWFSGVSAEGLRGAVEQLPWTHFDVEVLEPPEAPLS